MYTKTTKQKSNWLMAIVLLAIVFTGSLKAQLSGTKNIPGDYATLALAITDLNAQGVGAGGVTLNLLSGNPETAPAGGYAITATGVLANPITIQGNSNVITANASLTAGALNDAIFKIIGGDYITISGFNMQENAANTATTAASNNMTEFGVAIFYASATDGAQNVTIQTNTITLNRNYQNTFGIYANSTHNATAVTTAATATGALGGTHNLKIYSNNISNINTGLLVVGPTAAADFNQGLDIGGASASSGNVITNFGTTGTFSSFSNVSGTVNGMQIRNAGNYNVSYNSVASSNGGTTSGTLNGIFMNSYSNTPSIAYTQAINNNTISLRSAVTAGAMNGINVSATSSFSTSTLSINNNDFNTFGHTVAGASGTIVYISSSMPVGTFNVNGNTFTNISVNTTGNTTFISHNFSIPSTGTSIISNNSIVSAYSKTGAGGTIFLTSTNSTSGNGSINNYLNNNFSNITAIGATAITGFNNTDGGTGSTKTISGNTLSNWTGGTSSINCMNITYWNGVSSLSNNMISNITGQSNVTGITLGSSANNATSISVSSNTLTSLSSTGTGAAVTGITCSNTSAQINLNNNFINTLSSTGASLVSGITISGSTNTNIFKNKIYDLSNSNTGGSVSGITSSGGTTNNIYNNIIGDLRAPNANAANPLNGINLTGGSNVNVSFNTVFLNATSSGANFGSSAISSNATPTSIDLRNNIFVNNSTPTGTAIAVAYRRSSTVLTNYTNTSNNNLFYAGTPSASTAIFTDGTNTYTTLAAYKTAMATRDQASITENPNFVSTTGSSSNFLHINPAISTAIESGAANISGITDDFDGDIRQGNPGYVGTGIAPDMGADEFAGTSPSPIINSIAITPTGNQCTAISRNVTANVSPGASDLTNVTLHYSFNGAAQTPITMTGGSFTTTSTWNATIPVGVPANATVAWYVEITDGIYTKTSNGTTYNDEPASLYTASAAVTPTNVCAGKPVSLSLNLLGSSTATYCTIAAATSTASYFNGFSTTNGVDNITNNTSGFSIGGYGNFTNLIASQKIGQTINFNTILAGTTVGVAIWVDWDQNGTFDATERVFNTTSYVSTASGSFSVPATAKLGSARMRIFMDYNNNNPATPCGPFSSGRGEAEDYTFVVLPSTNLTYSWTDGVSTFTSSTNTSSITVNASATYTGTAYIEGCPLTSTVQVNMTPLPSAPIVSNSSQCGVGVPTASVVGGANYNWYATPTSTTVLQSGSASNFTSSISSTTTWYVTSVNGACESTPRATVTTTVSIPDPVTANASSSNLCVGGANTITLTAVQTGTNNPYTFTWNASSTTGSGMPSSVAGASVLVTPSLVGNYTYSVTATDGVCTTISTVSVALNNPPSVTASANPTVVCSGFPVNLNAQSINAAASTATIGTGAITGTSYDGIFYHLFGGNKSQQIIRASELSAAGLIAGNLTALTINIPTAGSTYSSMAVSIATTTNTDMSSGINNTAAFTTVYSNPAYTTVSGANTFNFSPAFNWDGVSNIIVQICWSNNNGGGTSNFASVITTTYVSTAYYRADNQTGSAICGGSSATGTISKRALYVFNGQVGTNLTSTMNFVWNPGAINTNTAIVNPVNTGTVASSQVYTVTVTNTTTSCSNTATTSVLVNPLPSAPVVTNATQCGIGIPTASVSGGANYNWYATPTSTTVLQTGSASNFTSPISSTTTWYVTSVNGDCESTPRAAVTQTVTNPDPVTANTSSSNLCVGGANTITLTAVQTGTNNLYTFTWSASTTTGSGMPSSVTGASVLVTPSLAGNYTYSVTATDGVCTTISTVSVGLNDLPIISNASATPTAICSGSTFSLNANSFIGGPQTVPTGYCTPSSSGSACLTSVSINTLNRTSACETGFYLDVPSSSATTNLTPGQTYTLSLTTDAAAITSVWFDWNRDGVFTASEWFQPFTSASTGSISVLVPLTANGGLTKMRVRSRLSGNTNGSGDACTSFGSGEAEDYTINVQTDNTANYSWVWNPGSLSGNSLTTSTTNTTSSAVTKVYTVTATSSVTGCSNTATTSVLVNPLPVSPVATNASQCGVAVPTASVSGGVFYNWYATPTSTSNIQAGATSHYTTSISNTTTWYVTSFNGTCESSPRVAVTQSVTVPDAVSASSSATKLCVGGANTITLTATQTGTNSNAYAFTWSASPSAGSGISSSITGSVVSVTPSSVGNYIYNLSASDGTCVAVSSVSVSLNSIPSISTTATPSVICSGANVGLDAQSINIATGTASVGTQGFTGTTGTPYMQGSGIANDLKVQYLYTAAELNAAGIYAGNITDIRFNATAAGSGMINNFEIKMGTTSTTSLTTAYDFPPSTVYGPYSYSVTLGQNIHTFDTPFNWDGVSNVIIEICHDAVSPAGVSSTLSQQTATNRVIYSNTATACGLATGNSTSSRPLIGFSGQVGTNITSSLTWTWNPGAIASNTAVVTPINTGSTAVTNVYTITVNNATTTCSNTGTVGILVNEIPTTPVVTNATQCGVGVPTSSVSGGTNYNWYATPTSTTVLQSGTSTNFTTSISNTTSWYVTSVSTASCQSPRAQVTSSVTIPDAVTAAVSSASICPNTTVALIATNTGTTNTYSYTWTAVPATGSGITGSVSGSSVSISPSLSGNYVYSLTAVDGACTAVNTVSLNVFQTIATPTAIATPSVLCSGNSATLSLNSSANVTVGTATTTTQGNSGLSPYAQYWEGQRTQYLFKANELTSFGLSAGNITSLSFSVTTASATMTFSNYAIKMYHTTATDLATTYAANSSPIIGVFGPINLAAPAVGVNTHNFATPFNWDGTSNVIVDICFENDPTSAGTFYTNNTTVAANTVSGFTSVRGDYADNSSLCNTSNTGTSATSSDRPRITFKGNSLPGVTTIDWTTGVTSVGSGSVVSVSPSTTSTYTATLTDNHSCVVMSTPVTVTVNTTPTVSAVASNTAVCAGSPATLTASGATTYSWTSGGSAATENVTPTALTVYTVTGTTNGCSSTATVSVDALAVPSISVAASSSSLCSGNSTTLTASGATNYTWTSGGNTSTEVVTPSTTTTYTVTGEAAGCSGTGTVAINVTATPTIAIAPSNATVCTGNSATLTASGATNYTWTSGGTSATESVTPTALTVYTVTGATNGCSSTATVSVDINSIIPTVTVSASSASVCSGSSATLTAGGATTYTWTSGGTTATEIVTPTTLTVYTVTGETSGCSNTATVSLAVNQTPTVSAVASQTLLCDDGSTGSSILTASSNGTSYLWSDGATTMTTVVTPSVTSVYTITATGNGCSADAYVTVTVSNCNGIKDLASDEISIFPNPTNGNVTISIPASVEGNVTVEVYDAIGKLTIKENITNNMSNVNLSKLEDGMYMFKIINNNKTIKIGKIVKQ